jgi:hypothetical protein
MALRISVAIAGLAAWCAGSAPVLPEHPRLILTPSRVQEIQASIANDSTAALFYGQLITHATWLLSQAPINEPTPGPSGVLIQVRQALDAMLTSALAYTLSGNTTFADRALLEAYNAAGTNWTDWNPSHFLDTGEMTAAVALTLDWLWDYTPAPGRDTLYAALLNKGMTPFATGYTNHTNWWFNSTINWNCVCAGGGIIGALAIADYAGAPDWVWSNVYAHSAASLPACVAAYGPDSSWMEGVGYWGYASKYAALADAAMRSALDGDDGGLFALPGVALAGRFPIFMQGTSAYAFDWADDGAWSAALLGVWSALRAGSRCSAGGLRWRPLCDVAMCLQ